ncbi:MAG: DUF4079 family protein [Deltaproteobacteria bacterium]|nr:DUF4079 family protein [Deltaproteobacteria bacterium]
MGTSRWIAFFHPFVALATLVFMAWVASLGLRSRDRLEGHLRARHARLAAWAYGLMVFNVAAGLVSTRVLRPDLDARGLMHFRLAVAIVVVMTAAAWLSRRIERDATARMLHPILGLLALVLSGLQVFFGMPLLPL